MKYQNDELMNLLEKAKKGTKNEAEVNNNQIETDNSNRKIKEVKLMPF